MDGVIWAGVDNLPITQRPKVFYSTTNANANNFLFIIPKVLKVQSDSVASFFF